MVVLFNLIKMKGNKMAMVTKAPMWADSLDNLIAILVSIGNGTYDEQKAPELCQIPPHVAKLLAAEITALKA